MKVAVPTDDGVHIAKRFGRAQRFIVAEITLGQVLKTETRNNPVVHRTTTEGRHVYDPHKVVTNLLSDCRAVIACSIGETMREHLTRRGVEVIITSEALAERALAHLALITLSDESKIDPTDVALSELLYEGNPVGDDYDA